MKEPEKVSKKYIVIIEETWEYHIKVEADSNKEAVKKVDGGNHGRFIKVTQHLVRTTAHEDVQK